MAALFSARPHWGKLGYLKPDKLRALYPRFDVFQKCCQTFDPDGLFQNDWTSELLENTRPLE
jgi:alditol oxidase